MSSEIIPNKPNLEEGPVLKPTKVTKNKLFLLSVALFVLVVLNIFLYLFLPSNSINKDRTLENTPNGQSDIEISMDPLAAGFWKWEGEEGLYCSDINLDVNEENGIAQLICMTSTGGKTVLELPEVDTNTVKVYEKAGGDVYVKRRVGEWHQSMDTWQDELWRFTKNLEGKRIYTRKGIAFHVSESKNLIAIEGKEFLTFIDKKGNEIDKIDTERLNVFPGEDYFPAFYKWGEDHIWFDTSFGPNLMALSKYNLTTGEVEKYDLTDQPLGPEYILNVEANLLAFSNFPALYETTQAEHYRQSGEEVNLYIYDIDNATKTLVNTAITKKFNPSWVDKNTLEYTDPTGERRLLYHIGDN